MENILHIIQQRMGQYLRYINHSQSSTKTRITSKMERGDGQLKSIYT